MQDIKKGKKIKKPLQGGNGIVHFVKGKSGREYAIKIPLVPSLSFLENELEIMKILSQNCPSVVICYYGLAKTKFGNGLIMEYVNGRELFEIYEKNIQISVEQQYTILYHLFSGINCMHSLGIAHRDIKLENIIFNENGIKIIDFGDACYFKNSKNICNNIRGTKECMSPEIGNNQILLYPKLWPCCDVWASGIVMLELIFNGDHPEGFKLGKKYKLNYDLMQETMTKFLNKNFKIGYDSGIIKVISLMLITNPKKRITASKVMTCLNKISKKEVFNAKLSL